MRKKEPDSGRTIVASGAYVVGAGKGKILDAYLGSCVGVALYDRQARVGGLIHLLLPEPPSIDSPWEPEIYAATGLPLIIRELGQRGASKKNLEATVAGGALVGPLSKQDLTLDLGGRTADVVGKILRKEKIVIRKTEIGGYFSCRLSLNLETGKIEIDPIGIAKASTGGTDFEKPGNLDLARVIRRVRPIPQIALKVIRMISEQDYQLGDVAQQIMQDQVLSAKVIRFCNSVYAGGRTRVDSIEKAMLIIGEKWLLQLIVKTSLEDFLSQPDGGYSLCKGGLFQHACGTAAMARELAQFTGLVAPDLAYTAGLLHDIGKVVLDQYMHTARPLFYRTIQKGDADLIRAESELFGVIHTEVGGQLAGQWSIPENLCAAIRYHHQPERATSGSELTHLVYLADLIMSRFMVGQEMEKLNTDAFVSRLHKVGLNPDQFSVLIGRIPAVMADSPWQDVRQ
jgi:putative nucleotidyltransferase with HDIG domain